MDSNNFDFRVNSCASDSDDQDSDQDEQMAFVILLSDFKVLFNKSQVPEIKRQKEIAAKQLAEAYSKNSKKNFTNKQIMKKFNNMKTKVKEASDRQRTGNKKITLTDWQKKFLKIWENEKVNNRVLSKIPECMIAGVTQSATSHPLLDRQPSTSGNDNASIVKKKRLSLSSGDENEPEEFRNKTLQQLQRQCLIEQIKAAQAQELAAKEMAEYYRKSNNTKPNKPDEI